MLTSAMLWSSKKSHSRTQAGASIPALGLIPQLPSRTRDNQLHALCLCCFRHKLLPAQDVVDLSWSSTHFLLSASVDCTVRLWHISTAECLRSFRWGCDGQSKHSLGVASSVRLRV